MPWNDCERPIRTRKRENAQIGRVRDNGFDDFVRVKIGEPYAGLRVLGRKILRIPSHVLKTDRIDYGYANLAFDPSLMRVDIGLGFFQALDDFLARIKENIAFQGHVKKGAWFGRLSGHLIPAPAGERIGLQPTVRRGLQPLRARSCWSG